MAIKSIDLTKRERGVGIGKIETILGDPFATTVSRVAVAVVETQVGNADGYDASTANELKVYYDLVKGAATFVDIIFKAIASDLDPSGVPVPKGTGGGAVEFLSRLPLYDSVSDRQLVIPSRIRLVTDERGCVTIPRPTQAFKIFLQSDNVAAVLALAVQSAFAGGS